MTPFPKRFPRRHFLAYTIWIIVYWFMLFITGNAPDGFYRSIETPSRGIEFVPIAIVIAQCIRPTLLGWWLLLTPTVIWMLWLLYGVLNCFLTPHTPSSYVATDLSIFIQLLIIDVFALVPLLMARPKLQRSIPCTI